MKVQRQVNKALSARSVTPAVGWGQGPLSNDYGMVKPDLSLGQAGRTSLASTLAKACQG
jgi:hypothetical protein